MARVVRDEDDGRLDEGQKLVAPHLGGGDGVRQRSGDVVDDDGSAQAHRVATRPRRVVVDTEVPLRSVPVYTLSATQAPAKAGRAT